MSMHQLINQNNYVHFANKNNKKPFIKKQNKEITNKILKTII